VASAINRCRSSQFGNGDLNVSNHLIQDEECDESIRTTRERERERERTKETTAELLLKRVYSINYFIFESNQVTVLNEMKK
jgi:hypothetical protein